MMQAVRAGPVTVRLSRALYPPRPGTGGAWRGADPPVASRPRHRRSAGRARARRNRQEGL